MTQVSAAIPEWENVDRQRFYEEIVPQNRPAVLRGHVAEWPAVQAARQSPQAMCAYIKRFDTGTPAGIVIGDPSIQGRFFYQDDVSGLNFERRKMVISMMAEGLLTLFDNPHPPSVFLESVLLNRYLPGFAEDNVLTLPPSSATPRIWIGNAATVATHYDLNDNVACVVAGRRRFTLFPPDQIANLYVGPIDFTPAGAPVSMVRLEDPDFAKFPRFEAALKVAMAAELEPGDAIYIPYFWWHHVQSLTQFNILVNYWWNETPGTVGLPMHALLYGLLALQGLPDAKREAWRSAFDYFVFKTHGDPAAHLPAERQGVLGSRSPEAEREVIESMIKRLQELMGPS